MDEVDRYGGVVEVYIQSLTSQLSRRRDHQFALGSPLRDL